MVGECEMLEYLSGGECHALRTEDPAHLNSSGCLNVDEDKVEWTSTLKAKKSSLISTVLSCKGRLSTRLPLRREYL